MQIVHINIKKSHAILNQKKRRRPTVRRDPSGYCGFPTNSKNSMQKRTHDHLLYRTIKVQTQDSAPNILNKFIFFSI